MARLTTVSLVVFACLAMLALPGYCAAESTTSAPLQNKQPGISETPIGDLVADAFRSQMGTDVAFVAAGDLKASDTELPAGKVSSVDVSAFLAYPDDTLTVLALNGKTIIDALERSVSGYPRPGLGFLQVSGLKYSFEAKKKPGERITSVTISDKPISPDKTYTVAVMKSLADGALGYWKVWSKSNIVAKTDVVSSSTAIERFMLANSKLNYSSLNRISVIK
ncbi:MAG: 5'-nucleotidase [Armatimonadota bacterium]|jgi:2',3'-cyclic-nucleotide 2'-phosphodiesterase (5'-nucleotidase family)